MNVSTLTEAEQNRLIVENTGLVACIAADYRGQKGIPFEELVAEGMLGLVQAARHFDPSKAKFSAFARHWIRGAIKQLIDRWEVFERLDGAIDPDEDRIHEWQVWGVFPGEGWSSLSATPAEILEIYEEFSDKKEAIEAAFISLIPRERKMVQAHFLRQPRVGLDQIARDHRVSYKRAQEIILGAVKKMRDLVERIENNKSGVSRMGRPRHAARQGLSSRHIATVSKARAGGPQFQTS
jgi:RNA polymerase sigma factor (sigma-70 family)